MSDWTCRCTAKNADGSRYCEGCGAENQKASRPLHSVPKTAEGYDVWREPKYAEPPATPEQVRAALANIKALLADKMTLPAPGSRFPPIDPAVRDAVERKANP
jgi:hypothetical protein